ncbi:MAG TPA: 5-methyltetrahydropteroyltriglutamate--homocysteine methyltransferase [Firmicutes bacterium]|jgi:5-methyltetrahydropteroyltriglutamate--homocysteine methyltransferase|nr:5-methyltetrahydropteroyltriglutamate--homocysteine methyltransferase [Bacillota bacterium]
MSKLFENARKRELVPFRFDVVGSFLRPQAIKEAREKFAAGAITRAELAKVEDSEIEKLVAQEKATGLKAVTDGEFRRSYWHLDFFWGFAGVEHIVLDHGYFFHGEETRADSARLSGKIRFSNHPFLSHYRFLKQVAGNGIIARQNIPAPAQFFAELVRGENKKTIAHHYPDREELYKDISAAYHQVILAFYDLGCRNIQLDDCTWGMLCDQNFWSTMAGKGYDVQALQELYLRLNNEAIADLPADLTVTTHVCRGNYHSTWATSGGYEPVAPTLLARENVNAFYLEFDTERAGNFAPLRHVPASKPVVLGLFSSKTGVLEDKNVIFSRIQEATQYLPIDQLCISPQCGFASTEEGNILTEEQQWAKLRFIKEIADEIWK